uniref:Transposase (putative) gypsy type domain-containing protein n=1 Tax=Fagus sylvatica TaxID=28930 RepID=A0A2N9HZC0_FAGSY
MAAGGFDWPAVLSEEPPEGPSSSRRENEGTSSEATTSALAKPRQPIVPKRWAVYSYFSRFTDDESLSRDVTLYESASTAGLRFPVQPFIRELLDFLSLAPGQVAPNGWRVIITCMVIWRECSDGLDDITVEEFLYCFEPSQIATSPGFWTFRNKEESSRLVEELLSSNRRWKDGYFFVSLTRSTLAPVWKDRVLRAHRLTTRAHTYYIQPELLFRHSFGPEPTAAVLSLIETNKKRVATMKINKSKLKDMVEKGVPVVPVSVKRKRTDDGPSSAPPTPSVRPSKTVPLVQASPSLPSSPPVVQIPDEEIPFVPFTDDGPTICRSLGLAAKRAEVAITELDFKEYAIARTEEISKLMSLNEAMVVSRRCLTAEDELDSSEAKVLEQLPYQTIRRLRPLKKTTFNASTLGLRHSGSRPSRNTPTLTLPTSNRTTNTDSVNEDGRKDDRDQADDATS